MSPTLLTPPLRRTVAGFSLVELMVALVIGSVLIIGAVYTYSQSRSTYRLNEAVARLQEQGRYVFSVIEPDVELAGFYGFTNAADAIRLVSGGDPGLITGSASQMRQFAFDGGTLPTALPNLPAGAHVCGVNFAVDVLMPIQGSNDTFALGRDQQADCGAHNARPQPETDTLTIRRADERPAGAPEANRLQIYASRLTSRTSHLLFADGQPPGVTDDDNRIHNLIVRSYYIAQDSVDRPNYPALRVKTLTLNGGALDFLDTEVMPGVEDLQVQFGIDTADYDNDGVMDPGMDVNGDGIPETDGRATRYVNPDFPDLGKYQIVSVRVWVMVRAEEFEVGFVDDKSYEYAGRTFTPAADAQRFRRALMSRTIALRNARTL